MNVAELNRVLDHCAAHPEQHVQDSWIDYWKYEDVWIDDDENLPTLTADWEHRVIACVAGWTAILNGWRPVHPESYQVGNDAGEISDIAVVARKILGLTREQAFEMFSQASTVEAVRQLAQRFAEETAR